MNDLSNVLTSIFILSSAATAWVKGGVDMYKMARPCGATWEAPTLAMLLGVAIVFLLMLATGTIVTMQTGALAVLGGLASGFGAVGVTALHKAARPEENQ